MLQRASRLLLRPALLAALACAGCKVLPYRRIPLLVASDPPGASIWVDGDDSGWVTPRHLALDLGERHAIELRRSGYEPQARIVEPDGRVWVLHWNEMVTHAGNWRFPLWVGVRDVLLPIKRERLHSPARVYVHLRRTSDA